MNTARAKFAVYYNRPNPHINIHKIGVHKLKIHGGVDNYNSGGWKYFATESEAVQYAKNLSRQSKRLPEPTYCKICY